MGFVNESIDTPERIREFTQLNLLSPFDRKPLRPWRWAVDRSRGYYFVSLGGGSFEIPFLFALVVPNGRIEIEGTSDEHGAPAAGNVEIHWRLSEVRIPKTLASRADALMAVVREAFEARGLSFDDTPVKTLTVTLPPPKIV